MGKDIWALKEVWGHVEVCVQKHYFGDSVISILGLNFMCKAVLFQGCKVEQGTILKSSSLPSSRASYRNVGRRDAKPKGLLWTGTLFPGPGLTGQYRHPHSLCYLLTWKVILHVFHILFFSEFFFWEES